MRGLRRTRACALLAGVLLTVAGCGSDSPEGFGEEEEGDTATDQGTVTIAAQDFTGGQVMSQLYAQLLASEGYTPEVKLVSTRDLYMPELQSGRVQVVPEYLAGITDFLNIEANGANAKLVSSGDPDETMAALEPLAEDAGITMLEPAPASDQNAFFVTTERAEEEGLVTLSDLADTGQPVTLAAPADCKGRDDCEKGLTEVYGIDITSILPTGYGTTQTKNAVIEGEADLGETGTTDGSLEELGLVLLEDDMSIQPAQNLTPALNSEWYAENPEVKEVLNDFSVQFTTEDLAALSLEVDVERADPAEVAEEYLADKGFV